MDVGKALAAARQRAGLTPEEISRRTGIKAPTIEALEENEFWRLPQGAYLDGLVRAYAREVGLDPDELVHHVHMDSERRTAESHPRAELDAFPSEANDPRAEPHHSALPELDVLAGEEEREERSVAPLTPDPGDHVRPAQPSERDEWNTSVAAVRPATTIYHPDYRRPSRHRWGFVIAAFAGAVVGAIATAAFLYRSPWPGFTAQPSTIERSANNTGTTGIGEGRTPSRRADSTTGVTDSGPRRGTIDTAREAPPEGRSSSSTPPRASSDATAPEPAAPPEGRSSPPTPARPPSDARAPVPAAPPAPGRAAGAPASTSSQAVPELTGVWTIATRVETSSVNSFEGLQLGYYVNLQQNGNSITGTGRKVSENGRMLGRAGQTPIALQGTVEGDAVVLNFSEAGTRRRSSGTFILTRAGSDALQGRFSSDAARSTGTVEVRRR